MHSILWMVKSRAKMHAFYLTDGQKTYKNACILSYGWLNRKKMHAFRPTDGQKHIKLNQPILQMVKKCKNAYVLPTGEELVCKNTCILP